MRPARRCSDRCRSSRRSRRARTPAHLWPSATAPRPMRSVRSRPASSRRRCRRSRWPAAARESSKLRCRRSTTVDDEPVTRRPRTSGRVAYGHEPTVGRRRAEAAGRPAVPWPAVLNRRTRRAATAIAVLVAVVALSGCGAPANLDRQEQVAFARACTSLIERNVVQANPPVKELDGQRLEPRRSRPRSTRRSNVSEVPTRSTSTTRAPRTARRRTSSTILAGRRTPAGSERARHARASRDTG